jgi:hypothetical protein
MKSKSDNSFLHKFERSLENGSIAFPEGDWDPIYNRSQYYTFNGSKNIELDGKQVWKQPVAIEGADYFSNQVENYKSPIKVFNYDFKMNMDFYFDVTSVDVQFSVAKFKWNLKNFAANARVTKNFYEGTWNMTRIHRLPVLITLPYYYGLDRKLADSCKPVNLNNQPVFEYFFCHLIKSYLSKGGKSLPESLYLPEFRIEQFSGFTFGYNLPFQVKKNLAFISKI